VNIGLIAGNGTFPFLVLRAAVGLGHDVTVVGIQGEADTALEELADDLGSTTFAWIPLGHLETCISTLTDAGVTQAVMAGQVKHVKLFTDVMPDATMMAVLGRLTTKNTDALISGIAEALASRGVTLMDSTQLLPEFLARPGVLTAAVPSADMLGDFAFGYRIADAVAGLDIGQTVVVKNRAVVAVEAMEGTDVVITRAGTLAGKNSRVVKVAKPGQDMRFDVPVVGVETVRAMHASGADGLSVDAGRTLILDGDAFFRAADEAGLVVVGRPQA
jgi:DUF1009 family protein